MRAGPRSICLRRTGWLRLDERGTRKRPHADDHFLYGESHNHQLRYKQHAELGIIGGDEYCHHAGNVRVLIGKWIDEQEPNRHHHLHADRNQFRWIDRIDANSDCKDRK